MIILTALLILLAAIAIWFQAYVALLVAGGLALVLRLLTRPRR
jgi:hypothetical protein